MKKPYKSIIEKAIFHFKDCPSILIAIEQCRRIKNKYPYPVDLKGKEKQNTTLEARLEECLRIDNYKDADEFAQHCWNARREEYLEHIIYGLIHINL